MYMSQRKLTPQYFATYFNKDELEKIYISEIQSAVANAVIGNFGNAQARMKSAIIMGEGLKILKEKDLSHK